MTCLNIFIHVWQPVWRPDVKQQVCMDDKQEEQGENIFVIIALDTGLSVTTTVLKK